MEFPEIIFEARPEWVALYEKSLKLALENIDVNEYRPGWLPQMTCMPGIPFIWQWDSCFMALYAKYLNGVISPMNNLDNLYSLQSEDGYISMTYDIIKGTQAYGVRVNPPLYAWCEWEYYRFSGDRSRIDKVLPKLVDYYYWLKNNRRRKNGLYFFEDTGSSGMDNSPRSGYAALHLDGSDVCWIDLGCQQIIAANHIAKLAQVIGKDDIFEEFSAEAQALGDLINSHHYKSSTGFYYDVFHPTNNALANKTIAGFWPLLAKITDSERTRALIRHLTDPAEFWTAHPVPSLSADDPNFVADGGYWLGSVWAPTNYMVVKGLLVNGYHALARDIAMKHLTMMAETAANPAYDSIWECYSPTAARPATRGKKVSDNGMLVRDRFVGWSALGPVAMFIENILGLDFNGAENLVTWFIANPQRHGIGNFCFAGKEVSLLCEGKSAPGKTVIKAVSTGNFTLKVLLDGKSEDEPAYFEVSPGENTFTL
ncbi:MAG: hypothetical protein IJW33_00765 [Lentisphaeria bacterium]|nr:hypothetical protein [Lentisphaeria bacterium]